jgi:transposase
MSERAVFKRVAYLGRKVGAEGLSPHDLRHHWATRAARNGTPAERLKDAGGWTSIATADRYVQDAAQALTQWLEHACEIGAKPFQAFVTTVENSREQILNFFYGRSSNGFAEGVNNKIKLVRRRAYGCPNFQHFRLRVLVAFGP